MVSHTFFQPDKNIFGDQIVMRERPHAHDAVTRYVLLFMVKGEHAGVPVLSTLVEYWRACGRA